MHESDLQTIIGHDLELGIHLPPQGRACFIPCWLATMGIATQRCGDMFGLHTTQHATTTVQGGMCCRP